MWRYCFEGEVKQGSIAGSRYISKVGSSQLCRSWMGCSATSLAFTQKVKNAHASLASLTCVLTCCMKWKVALRIWLHLALQQASQIAASPPVSLLYFSLTADCTVAPASTTASTVRGRHTSICELGVCNQTQHSHCSWTTRQGDAIRREVLH